MKGIDTADEGVWFYWKVTLKFFPVKKVMAGALWSEMISLLPPSHVCSHRPSAAALVDQRPHKKPDIQTELLNALDHVHAGRTTVIISDQIATI